MAIEGIQQSIPGLTTATDLSTTGQYRFVKISADYTVAICNGATDCPVGVLQNAPKANYEANVACFGVTKVYLGGTVAFGARVGTDANGAAVALVEGTDTTKYIVGVAMEAGINGDIRSILLNGTPNRAA